MNQRQDVMEEFISIYEQSITRTGADKLLEYLKKSSFFEDPASSRYHLCVPGGLCEHSIHVYKRLKLLCDVEAANDPDFVRPSDETIAICGLLHDLCKIGCYAQEYRNRKTYDEDKVAAAKPYQIKSDGQGQFIWESVMSYRFDDPMPYGHGEKSVYIISGFMPLSREEAFAIRYHMGPWNNDEQRNVGKVFEMYPFAFLTHTADAQATYRATCSATSLKKMKRRQPARVELVIRGVK